MATYSIIENPKWVKVITVHSNNPININSDSFSIKIKEAFEYFIYDYLSTGDTFELEERLKFDTEPTVEISINAKDYDNVCPSCSGIGIKYSHHPTEGCTECGGSGRADTRDLVPGDGMARWDSVPKYNNADDLSLIENGVQFWLNDNKTLVIRVITKGKNKSGKGYRLYNPVTETSYDTEYVGFCVAHFNIKLNDKETIKFDCTLMPKIDMNDPIPSAENPDYFPHFPASGYDRVDYDWNEDGYGINNLYVNNTSSFDSSAYKYEQDYNSATNKWFTKGPLSSENYATPLYIVESSAYTNDYLLTDKTVDLLDSGYSAARGFKFKNENVKSTLYDEYTQTFIDLPYEPYDFSATQKSKNVTYFSASDDFVSGTIYWNEITQQIINSADHPGKIRKNQVKLDIEI